MANVILITSLVMECEVILSVWELKQFFLSVSYLTSFPSRKETTGFGYDSFSNRGGVAPVLMV